MPLAALAQRWSHARAAERANAQSYLIELCHALGVEPPRPAGTGYEFEFPVRVVSRSGEESTNFVDLYRKDHFALEAKDSEAGRPDDLLLRKAFGQVRFYAANVPHERPPYLLVLDVGRTLLVWDRWRGDYGGFSAARRIDLRTLAHRPDDVQLLRDIWTDPAARDPSARAAAITRELAGQLAGLAARLEAEGYESERVARFLMRCIFTMFAEDVGLLPGEPFTRLIDEAAMEDPADFVPLAEQLWRAMDRGDRFLLRKLLRFNGHFFQDAEALPLGREAIALLLQAAQADWSMVEPTIFGTLLTRALDAKERHRLGAEYTPRDFIERLVRPTVEEPIRERWTAVQVAVVQLRESGRAKDDAEAEQRIRDFLAWLRALAFLDPACGSGNFLYVTMHAVKRIELEAIRLLEELTGAKEMRLEEVDPHQFHGIEVKPWAREIAELTLWIGFHQFWKEHHDLQPPEPILQDTGTLELKDAVLAWDEIVHVAERDRPDPTPRLVHPVTGKLVPDPEARLPYLEHRGARPAEWPSADFIIGNPPYMGQARMRDAFGDGYVEALRGAYPEVPHSADFVMYWWHRAAEEVAAGRTVRAGLITTNTITQAQNRVLIERAAEKGARVAWAVADHPWTDETGSADVRVAMTVVAKEPVGAMIVKVDRDGEVIDERRVTQTNADLTAHADVSAASSRSLRAHAGLSSRGFMLFGAGFILRPDEAERLLAADASHTEIVKQYRNGRDLSSRPRGVYLIDFGLRTADEAAAFPLLYNIIRDRVKPERDANKEQRTRERWWQFGRNREELRGALADLPRYIATVETSKHRFFTFLGDDVAPDNMLVCIASDDAFHLGVLSSSIHVAWALAAGGRLGIGNDPRYNKTLCFDPFPFPAPTDEQRAHIADLAERLDAHRKAALERDEQVTMTGMYNVVEKLRTGEALTAKERAVHELAACGVLKDLHDALDAAVAAAYGWEWPLGREAILERLVALHAERVAEEAAGVVRWLRPEYQIPRFGQGIAAAAAELDIRPAAAASRAAPWPATTLEQIGALQALLAERARTLDDVVAAFAGARRDLVERHLETLALMGEARRVNGHYEAT